MGVFEKALGLGYEAEGDVELGVDAEPVSTAGAEAGAGLVVVPESMIVGEHGSVVSAYEPDCKLSSEAAVVAWSCGASFGIAVEPMAGFVLGAAFETEGMVTLQVREDTQGVLAEVLAGSQLGPIVESGLLDKPELVELDLHAEGRLEEGGTLAGWWPECMALVWGPIAGAVSEPVGHPGGKDDAAL